MLFFDIEACLVLFFTSIMVTLLNHVLFYGIFKWLNFIAITFACVVLLGIF